MRRSSWTKNPMKSRAFHTLQYVYVYITIDRIGRPVRFERTVNSPEIRQGCKVMIEVKRNDIHMGEVPRKPHAGEAAGEYLFFEGERYYRIVNYDSMPPFFMSIVSNSDHWMFISSTGGLTAGRRNADSALFPYYTDDRVAENAGNTGALSVFLVDSGDGIYLWEPFTPHENGLYRIERNLYKNVPGNKLVFEEINLDLGLSFSSSWRTSESFGFVKTSRLTNRSGRYQKNQTARRTAEHSPLRCDGTGAIGFQQPSQCI